MEELRVEWPALFVAIDWIEAHCVIPDGFRRGAPFELADWQAWCLLNHYRVRPDAVPAGLLTGTKAHQHEAKPASAFHNRRSQIVMPQKAGKGPLTASQVALEGVGPAVFHGFAEAGDGYDCRDWGCGCGWAYAYEPGEAMARPWPTPLIQVTATSEDQTGNIYDAFRPMVTEGPLADLIPKVGEMFTRLPGGGRIDTVTSSATSRLGQRVTFVAQDETGIWTRQNGMVHVAETQRRGLAGMGGRAVETLNAWDPAEESVGRRTAEAKARDVFRYHRLPPARLDYRKKRDRTKIHRFVYAGCPWVDLDAIEAEAAELLEVDPGQAERFFGNRPSSGQGKAFNLDRWAELGGQDPIAPGRRVVLGFDGSRFDDSTALVATDVESGVQQLVGLWEDDGTDDWEVPADEVDAAVTEAFSTWKVWRLYADPPGWDDWINTWHGRWRKRVVRWHTNQQKRMAYAVRRWADALKSGDATHVDDDDLTAHVGHAQRRPTKIRDEDGRFMWTIYKSHPTSPLKIDAAVASILSWEARGDAIAAGLSRNRTGGRVVGF